MKIRWTENSVRFRITPTELDRLIAGEAVVETLNFPCGALWSATLHSGVAPPPQLEASGGMLVVHLSDADRDRLAAPDAEGVYLTDAGAEIRLLVEKDFPCIHPRAIEANEPVTETFAPPVGFAERKA